MLLVEEWREGTVADLVMAIFTCAEELVSAVSGPFTALNETLLHLLASGLFSFVRNLA